jgi:ABC-type transporter Mla subunit MlaD
MATPDTKTILDRLASPNQTPEFLLTQLQALAQVVRAQEEEIKQLTENLRAMGGDVKELLRRNMLPEQKR